MPSYMLKLIAQGTLHVATSGFFPSPTCFTEGERKLHGSMSGSLQELPWKDPGLCIERQCTHTAVQLPFGEAKNPELAAWGPL